MFSLAPLPRTLDAALRDSRHRTARVRRAAVSDLVARAEEAPDAVAEGLRALCAADPDSEVRAAAVLGLADACLVGSVAAVRAACQDREPRVRQLALVALGELAPVGDEASLELVFEALDSELPALRYQACIALSRISPGSLEEEFSRRSDDDDAEVRYIRLRLLEERSLDAPGPTLLRRCEAALSDAAPKVRACAAIVLGRIGRSAALAVIADLLNGRRVALEPEDEHALIELAVEHRIEGARPGLARRAWGFGSGHFGWQARVALAAFGDARARAAILRGLGSWQRDARNLAVVAAGQAGLAEARPLLERMQGDALRADPEQVELALARLREAAGEA